MNSLTQTVSTPRVDPGTPCPAQHGTAGLRGAQLEVGKEKRGKKLGMSLCGQFHLTMGSISTPPGNLYVCSAELSSELQASLSSGPPALPFCASVSFEK